MQGQCVVAVYESRDAAEQAYRAICEAGIPRDRVRLSGTEATSLGSAEGGTNSVRGETSERGFLDWLFGSNVPEEHQRAYNSRISGGHAAVSVYVDDAPSIANTTTVENILE